MISRDMTVEVREWRKMKTGGVELAWRSCLIGVQDYSRFVWSFVLRYPCFLPLYVLLDGNFLFKVRGFAYCLMVFFCYCSMGVKGEFFFLFFLLSFL